MADKRFLFTSQAEGPGLPFCMRLASGPYNHLARFCFALFKRHVKFAYQGCFFRGNDSFLGIGANQHKPTNTERRARARENSPEPN